MRTIEKHSYFTDMEQKRSKKKNFARTNARNKYISNCYFLFICVVVIFADVVDDVDVDIESWTEWEAEEKCRQ